LYNILVTHKNEHDERLYRIVESEQRRQAQSPVDALGNGERKKILTPLEEAESLLRQDDLDSAQGWVEMHLEENPQNLDALAMLAEIHRCRGSVRSAFDILTDALRSHPRARKEHYEQWFRLGVELGEDMESFLERWYREQGRRSREKIQELLQRAETIPTGSYARSPVIEEGNKFDLHGIDTTARRIGPRAGDSPRQKHTRPRRDEPKKENRDGRGGIAA
jgi:hypothetical protein